MKAIIETGGKQYYVSENDVIYVEKLDVEENKEVTFDKVLMIGSEVGNPYLEGAKVTAKVLKHGKIRKLEYLNMFQNKKVLVKLKVIVNHILN